MSSGGLSRDESAATHKVSAELWCREREFFVDNLLVRIHFIIVMIRWAGLAPWESEFHVPGSLTSTFLGQDHTFRGDAVRDEGVHQHPAQECERVRV